jgi:hypothetical protein
VAEIKDYHAIATAVYEINDSKTVSGWTLNTKDWVTGTWHRNGFQGGIYQKGTDVICGFKGTTPNHQSLIADITADLRLLLCIIPNQAGGAYHMARAAQEIAGNCQVSLTGHSLGGALAQVVGF